MKLAVEKRNEIKARLRGFFERSKVREVEFVDRVPYNLNSSFKDALLANKYVSWIDLGTDKVKVFEPNIRPKDSVDKICSHILDSAVFFYGLDGLFNDTIDKTRLTESLPVFNGLTPRLYEGRLHRLPVVDKDERIALCEQLHRFFGLDVPETRSARIYHVSSPLSSFLYRVRKEAFNEGNYEVAKVRLRESFRRYPDCGDKMVSLTNTAHFLDDSLGYKGVVGSLKVDINYLIAAGRAFNMTDREIRLTDWIGLFNNPIAVYKHSGNSYCVVLDKAVKVNGDYSLLGFNIPTPESLGNLLAVRGLQNGAGKAPSFGLVKSIAYTRPAKIKSLVHDSANSYRNDLVYMRPSRIDPISGHVLGYDLLNKMKSLGTPIKGGTSSLPDINFQLSTGSLVSITKLEKDFVNPKTASKKKSDMDSFLAEIRELDLKAEVSEARESKREETVEERRERRMDARFTASMVGKGSCKKLHDNGIFTAKDLILAGFDRLYDITGSQAALRHIADFLADNNLFIKPRDIDYQLSNAIPQWEQKCLHFMESVKVFYDKDYPMYLPQRIDGSAFPGGDTLHLIAASGMEKKNFLPIWMTEEELRSFGSKVGDASPVPVVARSGKSDWSRFTLENVYNISATTFPKDNKEVYKSIKETFQQQHFSQAEASSVKRLLWSFIDSNLVPDSAEKTIYHFNDKGVGAIQGSLQKGGVSLQDIVGENTIRQMERRAKTVIMYEQIKNITSKAKGERPNHR